ncbi:MAG: uroporphyrinogen decarboxylase family protein [Bacillota bacterium]
MNGKATALNALRGEKTERLPAAILSGGVWLFKRRNMSIGDSIRAGAQTSADIIADTYREIRSDILWACSGCNNIIIKALGGDVRYDEPGFTPEIERPLLNNAAEIDSLDISRIESDPDIGMIVETAKLLARECGQEFLVGSGQWGPFTLAGQMLGIKLLVRLLLKDKPALLHVLEFTREVCLKYWQLFIDAGVELLRASEMTASGDLISPKQFEEFVLPSNIRLFSAVSGKVPATMLHVCGNTTNNLPLFLQTGANAISIDSKVSLSAVRDSCAGRIAFAGNIDPVSVMLQGSQEKVREVSLQCAQNVGSHEGYILMPGCDLPPDVPIENVKVMTDTARSIPTEYKNMKGDHYA